MGNEDKLDWSDYVAYIIVGIVLAYYYFSGDPHTKDVISWIVGATFLYWNLERKLIAILRKLEKIEERLD